MRIVELSRTRFDVPASFDAQKLSRRRVRGDLVTVKALFARSLARYPPRRLTWSRVKE